MSRTYRIIAVAALACAVAIVLVIKQQKQGVEKPASPAQPVDITPREAAGPTSDPANHEALPRLVELGAGKCVPCKMMAPILEELEKEYADTFDVESIDVWENPKAAEPYNVRMIPTQIFYDAEGKELFRHEGFFGKEEILAKWKEHGVDVQTKAAE